jgi:hypothetical protein
MPKKIEIDTGRCPACNQGWSVHMGIEGTCRELQAAKELLKEVMEWHSDMESPDYNECDKEPCHWCTNAKLIVGVK